MRHLAYSFVVQLARVCLGSTPRVVVTHPQRCQAVEFVCAWWTIRASESTPIIWFLRLFISMPDAHPSGTILLTATPGKSLAGRDLTSFRAVSPRGPAGQADAEANHWLSDTGTIAGGVRQAFAAIDAGEVRSDEGNALLPGALSRVRGRRRGHRRIAAGLNR